MASSVFASVVRCAYCHTPKRGEWELCDDALICLDAMGTIAARIDNPSEEEIEEHQKNKNYRRLDASTFLLPGFVDTHIHAPQYTYTGNGLDLPLMQWLERYTFPAEARMEDRVRAKEVYSRVVKRTLRCGTTTACYFGTIHLKATMQLVDECVAAGQRGLCGLVSMDINAGGPLSRQVTDPTVQISC